MKVKLLKKLRNCFTIEYFPSKKLYKVNTTNHRGLYFENERDARDQRYCEIINFGRKYYEKYSKRIKIS